jgi:hypothetical protein
MKLSEFLELLQYGELANLSMSGGIGDTKGIRVNDYPAIISHINLALTDLHTKFSLNEREVTIQQRETITDYILDSKFAISNSDSTEPSKYILDSIYNKFTDDILRVNAVYDEIGEELPVNDENRVMSVFLSSPKVLQIPYPNNENLIVVSYRANHAKLSTQVPDLDAEIELPAFAVEALLSYVASRVHAQRTNQEAIGLSVNLMAKYHMLCDQISLRNMLHTGDSNSNIKLGGNGWV